MKFVSPYCLGLLVAGGMCLHPMGTRSAYTKIVSSLSSGDAHFLVKVSRSALLEVQLGQMALDKAANGEVKNYGENMVHDFQKDRAALRSLAAARSFSFPDSISSWAAMESGSLQFRRDGDFDESYLIRTLADHKHEADDLEKEAKYGDDPAVRAFAKKRISEISKHLHAVREIQIDMLTP